MNFCSYEISPFNSFPLLTDLLAIVQNLGNACANMEVFILLES